MLGKRVRLKYGVPGNHNERHYCDVTTGTICEELPMDGYWLVCMDADIYAEVVNYRLPSLKSEWGWQSIGRTVAVHELEMELLDDPESSS